MKRFLSIFMLSMLLCFMGTVHAAVNEPDFKPVADVVIGSGGITWMPKVNYHQLVLTVSRPDGTVYQKTFESGSSPYLDLSSVYGDPRHDGSYTYELQAVFAAGQGIGNSRENTRLKKEKLLPRDALVQTGYFRVKGGMIVTGSSPEQRDRTLDEVINDDLIVDGSLCVGNDCYSGYAFGFDTIVLMENNLRIYFDDTSNTSSFPNNDWRIVVNDTTDGGGAYFALQDVSGGLTPFTIEAGAKTNSLYVDDDGQVGIGTSGPVFELHIREGDTPTVRLHQDTSYGWPEQIWDVGGNETSFFIRDGTHAARLPFRIEPETPSSTLCLKSDGKVGIGTWSPGEPLELETTGEDARFIAERTSGATALVSGSSSYAFFGAITNHPMRYVSNGEWRMQLNTDNSMDMRNGAECDSTGHWNDASSREYKENIKSLALEEAVDTLKGLEPVKFNYKTDKNKEYAGFIAEDVPELVATKSRKTLGSLDILAVLTKVVQQQQESIREQQRLVREQQKTISQLNRRIAELEKK